MDVVYESVTASMSLEDVERLEFLRTVRESDAMDTRMGLRVRLRAISADKVTRNYTFYPLKTLKGDGERYGAVSATVPYPIPVMTDHRTTGAGFMGGGEMPIPVGRVVGAKVVGGDRPYLEMEALIVDRQAIEWILDGRFLTVSIGQVPGRVECSVCGGEVQGWTCREEHERGAWYDVDGEKRQCYHIMHDIQFIEVSFVNVPSDSDARVISAEPDTIQVGPLFARSSEMGQFAQVLEYHDAQVRERLEQAPVPYPDGVVGARYRGVNGAGNEEAIMDEVSLQELYALEGDAPDWPEAKLTAAQRKRLPDSAFCGPNRSFPAHDRAHVLAGLRLLGRAKLSPAQKARVRACLLRKAKALGMKTGDDKEFVVWVVPQGRCEHLEFSLPEFVAVAQGMDFETILSHNGTLLVEMSDTMMEDLKGLLGQSEHGASSGTDQQVGDAVPEQEVSASAEGACADAAQVEVAVNEERPVDSASGGVVQDDASVSRSVDVEVSQEEAVAQVEQTPSNEHYLRLQDELSALREENERLQLEMERLTDELQKVREELVSVRHQALVEQAARLCVECGYPLAQGRSWDELVSVLSHRTDEQLSMLVEDLKPGIQMRVSWAEAPTDVQNPVEGIDVSAPAGLPSEHAHLESTGEEAAPGTLDEWLELYRKGKRPDLRVQDEDDDEDSIVRLYFK